MLLCSIMSDSLRPYGVYLTRLLYPWDFPDRNSVVGCQSFSSGSSQPRDQTCISYRAGGFFTTEPQGEPKWMLNVNESKPFFSVISLEKFTAVIHIKEILDLKSVYIRRF